VEGAVVIALPSFDEVYAAANGREAFPWQRRLVGDVLAEGWPTVLDLPTGVGKTSALDIALYCLAAAPERMPRRIVLVVDRRIVVDQGAQHARALLRKLTAATEGPLAALADRLRALWATDETADETAAETAGDAAPFAVAVMRGGMPRDNDWARRPDQPLLGVSTVDQLGSRLLFRGYGVRPRSAPIHAGLVGNDTLILLDEVHLANAFARTLEAIQRRFRRTGAPLPDRFAVVQMSATARTTEASRVFQLDDADRAHPTLASRLGASKRAALQVVKVTGDDEARKLEAVATGAVHEALALQAAGARRVAIVVNRVDTARLAHHQLAKRERAKPAPDAKPAPELDATAAAPRSRPGALLITGRMRPLERDALVIDQLLPRVGATRARDAADPPVIVVATQCIEAGADLDFDAIVSECASLDALRQRFGRVDRRGERAQEAASPRSPPPVGRLAGAAAGRARTEDLAARERAAHVRSVILARSDQIAEGASDPVYGEALGATWRWLEARATDGEIDFGISAMAALIHGDEPSLATLLPPVAKVPVLLPTHLDLWAQTSQPPAADPDVALWLHGDQRVAADVQVIWRANIDAPARTRALDPDTHARDRLAALQACRPSSLESVTVPLAAVRRWLQDQPGEAISDVEAEAAGDDDRPRFRREHAADEPRAWRWRGDELEPVHAAALRPGDVLIVDGTRGGLASLSFDPSSDEPVVDLGDLAQLRGRGIATLRLDRGALAAWHFPLAMLAQLPAPGSDEDPEDLARRLDAWLALWPEKVPADFLGTSNEWRAARSALQASQRVTTAGDVLILTARARIAHEVDDAVTEDDDSSFRRGAITLAAHSGDVRDLTARYARSLGFSDALVADLALAAWLHDVGKADPRFQRWLVGGSELRATARAELLAKSVLPSDSPAARRLARERAGYPAGGRHELMSLALVQDHAAILRDAHDRDLVLHLVASHHGWCRPFAPPIVDPAELEVALQHGDHTLTATTRHQLARLDSSVAPRFWRLIRVYGWWGLAWLEAVMRLADHRATARAVGGDA
jgi:CRISPR-associated endonuclease/helicase Cas3